MDIVYRWTGSIRLYTVLALVLMLGGCATSAPVHYYQLSVMQSPEQPESRDAGSVRLGIGPVKIPPYLDRPQIAMRTSVNELSFADQHRWAEPLAENFSRVLAENLSRLMATNLLHNFPWPRSQPIDWQIIIEVMQFENMTNGNAVLEVRWMVRDGDEKVALPRVHNRFESTAIGDTQSDRIFALSQTLADLSREIASKLIELRDRTADKTH